MSPSPGATPYYYKMRAWLVTLLLQLSSAQTSQTPCNQVVVQDVLRIAFVLLGTVEQTAEIGFLTNFSAAISRDPSSVNITRMTPIVWAEYSECGCAPCLAYFCHGCVACVWCVRLVSQMSLRRLRALRSPSRFRSLMIEMRMKPPACCAHVRGGGSTA